MDLFVFLIIKYFYASTELRRRGLLLNDNEKGQSVSH